MLQLGEKCTMACETNKPIVSGSSQNHLIKIPSEISSLRGEYCIILSNKNILFTTHLQQKCRQSP